MRLNIHVLIVVWGSQSPLFLRQARRPLAMSKWMEQVKEAGHIPAQRVGMLAICQLQETSNRKLKVNAVGCRQAFGLLS